MSKTYTPAMIAAKTGTNPKAVRRRLRSKGIRVGKGNRHGLSKKQYDEAITAHTKSTPKQK